MMTASDSEKERELQSVWWELALTWRLYDAAIRENRIADAIQHARQREALEARARVLLDMVPRRI